MKLYIASDHAGFALKDQFLREFRQEQLEWVDLGPTTEESVDYPDFAQALVEKLKEDPQAMGVLICGSGQGVAMAANKAAHARAAVCYNPGITELSRKHNNANIICFGARFIDYAEAKELLEVFLKTPFEGGRHLRRVQKFSLLA